jgi:hypothetical protein
VPDVFIVGQAAGFTNLFSQSYRGAAGSVFFLVMMHFDYLDIIILAEDRGDFFAQMEKQIDPDAHIGGENYSAPAVGEFLEFGLAFGTQGGRTDNDACAFSDRGAGVPDHIAGAEVNDGVGVGKGFAEFIGDFHSALSASRQKSGVLPDKGNSGSFQRSRQGQIIRGDYIID